MSSASNESGKDTENKYKQIFKSNGLREGRDFSCQHKYKIFNLNKRMDFLLSHNGKKYGIEVKNQESTGTMYEKLGYLPHLFSVKKNTEHNFDSFDKLLIVVSGPQLSENNDEEKIALELIPIQESISNMYTEGIICIPIQIITMNKFLKDFNLNKSIKKTMPCEGYIQKLIRQRQKKQNYFSF